MHVCSRLWAGMWVTAASPRERHGLLLLALPRKRRAVAAGACRLGSFRIRLSRAVAAGACRLGSFPAPQPACWAVHSTFRGPIIKVRPSPAQYPCLPCCRLLCAPVCTSALKRRPVCMLPAQQSPAGCNKCSMKGRRADPKLHSKPA
jgi:hypothetical protein